MAKPSRPRKAWLTVIFATLPNRKNNNRHTINRTKKTSHDSTIKIKIDTEKQTRNPGTVGKLPEGEGEVSLTPLELHLHSEDKGDGRNHKCRNGANLV